MCMVYPQHIPITDLKHSVQKLQQKYSNLAFDANHKAITSMELFLLMEYCYRLSDTCFHYLENRIEIKAFVNILGFLFDIREHLQQKMVAPNFPYVTQKIMMKKKIPVEIKQHNI